MDEGHGPLPCTFGSATLPKAKCCFHVFKISAIFQGEFLLVWVQNILRKTWGKRVFALVRFFFPANNCHFCKTKKIEEKRLAKRDNKKWVGYVFSIVFHKGELMKSPLESGLWIFQSFLHRTEEQSCHNLNFVKNYQTSHIESSSFLVQSRLPYPKVGFVIK